MTYIEALSLGDKKGWRYAPSASVQAGAARVIAEQTGARAEALYDWANRKGYWLPDLMKNESSMDIVFWMLEG